MSKVFKSVAKFALPVIGTMMAPGIGTALGSTLSGAALSGIGGAIGGAAGGALGGGGIKGALTGAALGGAGGYISGAGGLGNAAQNLGLGSTGAIGPTISGAPLPSASGIAGLATRGTNALTSMLGSASSGGSILGGNPLLSLANLGGSLYSAQAGSAAAKEAANQQAASANQAILAQQQALTQIRGDLQPFREAGAVTTPQLTSLVNDPTAQLNFIQNNPFYAALAEDAKNKLFSNQAAKGKVGSGGTAEALQNSLLLLGNDLLNQDVTRKQNLATLGANAAAQTGTATQQSAGQIGGFLTDAGDARAAGAIGGYNAKSGAINNALSGLTSLYGIDRGLRV